ncbi:YjbH domain-containing protein [Celerinatantimonas yamalensis]|uniref:YjbH domain-containing protein n=1 Tax=Celerinatantimonas yamalensis TaxID=559956 RepID=A0ABW9G4B3_9GAMM
MQLSKLSLAAGLLLPCASAWANWSDHVEPSRNDFGNIGLIQMPSARMAPDGDISFNYSRISPYIFGAVNLQPLPWLNASIRYVTITNRLYGPRSLSGDQSYKDKGVDVKFRLWQEGYYTPDVSVGLRDIGGTGLFSSEFINATKRIGPFDVTLGMAWGYMGSAGDVTNPFCRVSNKFCDRSSTTNTGKVNFGDFFSGQKAALFGGVEYQTPWQPLSLKVELDGNNYQHEPYSDNQSQSSRINIGLNLKPTPYMNLQLAYERGNTLSFGVTLHTNVTKDVVELKHNPAPQPLKAAGTQMHTADWDKVASDLAKNAGLNPKAIYQSKHAVTVVGSQTKYRDRHEADTRTAAIAYNATDDKTRQFRVIEEENGLPTTQTNISRQQLKKINDYDYDFNKKPQLAYVVNPRPPQGKEVWHKPYQPLSFSLTPGLNQSLGGPDGFFLYQVILKGGADLKLTDNFDISGSVSANMLNNYNKFTYDAPSRLPRVRTYIREYLTTSKFGVNDLQATWFTHPSTNWYTQAYAGYLEYMYGGVGGEVLYRPLGSRWAIGANVNAVKQRNFDQRFGFRDYQTVTGHLNVYYQMPWDGITAEVDVGRYLAKDKGATFTITREFANGFRMGAYATLTNVSSADYGEGSFTKGVFISFPFDQISTTSTVQRGSVGWTPLTRDGGQKLIRKYHLYDMTEQRGSNYFDARNQ